MYKIIPERPPSYRTIADIVGEPDTGSIIELMPLYRQMVDNSNAEHEKRAGHFHPSSVGYCKRANLYQYYRVPPSDKRSKEFIEITALGHLIHDRIQTNLEGIVKDSLARSEVYRRAKVEFRREVPYDPKTDVLFQDLDIGGTCDGLLRITGPTWQQFGIVEIKSQNDEWFKRSQSQDGAHPDHLMQAHLYAFRFNAPIIWVWYFNKNNSKHELKPHFFDHEVFNNAVEYFAELNRFAEKRALPPREESFFECKECVYRTKCEPRVLKSKRASSAQPLTKLTFQRKK